MRKISLLLIAFFSFSLLVQAQTQKEQEMTPEMKAMMDAWTKYMTPGEPHKQMAGMAGTWKTHSKHWMTPGATPAEADGSCEVKMIMGDRYLYQECNGSMMNMPFNGIGVTGYDNAMKKYVGIWFDSMGTGIMHSTGTSNDGGKTQTYTGDYVDPLTNKKKAFRYVVKSIDANNFVFEWYSPGPDGKEFKEMEIAYTK